VVDPAICFAFIKRLSSELRHAALVKREAFFALGKSPRQKPSAKFEQTIANYGERHRLIRPPVLYRKEKL
jgi:hypothetical protein